MIEALHVIEAVGVLYIAGFLTLRYGLQPAPDIRPCQPEVDTTAEPQTDFGRKLQEALVPEPEAQELCGAPMHRGLVEVLRQTHEGWVHDSWVRRGSNAYERAINTPGYAVRSAGHNMKIEYGNQTDG